MGSTLIYLQTLAPWKGLEKHLGGGGAEVITPEVKASQLPKCQQVLQWLRAGIVDVVVAEVHGGKAFQPA